MSRLHCILTPVGSAGDVHPFIGIGRCLRERGHKVTLLTAEPFREACTRAGLDFVATLGTEEFERTIQHPNLWHPRRGMRLVMRTVSDHLSALYNKIEEVYNASNSGGTVLVGQTLAFASRIFEEKHNVPAVTLQIAPSMFRTEFEQPAILPGFTLSPFPRWGRRLLWWLIDRHFIDPFLVPGLNRLRAELGLPPVARPFKSWMLSPQGSIGLFPEWFGPRQPDWPKSLHLTGFPLFDESGQHEPNAALESFISEGSPPIVFTPGSANKQAPGFFQAAMDACALLNRRALLLTKYREQLPSQLPGHVQHVPYVPFSEVLPHCAALVHHGGIGTCAQALAAGVPQLIMPLGFDQPDNAMRLKRLGVGSWVAPGKFKGKRVAAALRKLLESPKVAEAARHCAQRTRSVDSLSRTCEVIESIAAAKLGPSFRDASVSSGQSDAAALALPR